MKRCTLTPTEVQLLSKLLEGIVIKPSPKARKKNNTWKCCKCGKTYYIHRHHVTYKPEVIKLLCRTCHKFVTSINTAGSLVAGGNKITRTVYTNKLRWALWDWFLKTDFPKGKKEITKSEMRAVLKEIGFTIQLR